MRDESACGSEWKVMMHSTHQWSANHSPAPYSGFIVHFSTSHDTSIQAQNTLRENERGSGGGHRFSFLTADKAELVSSANGANATLSVTNDNYFALFMISRGKVITDWGFFSFRAVNSRSPAKLRAHTRAHLTGCQAKSTSDSLCPHSIDESEVEDKNEFNSVSDDANQSQALR